MFETLKNLLVEELQLDPDEITMDAELTGDLGINSIELADLVLPEGVALVQDLSLTLTVTHK